MYNTRIMMVKDDSAGLSKREYIRSSADVYKLYSDLSNASQEEMHVIALDSKNVVIGQYMVSRGTLTASLVHPREVFKFLFLQNAANYILVHNHPSGQIDASPEDYEVTARFKDVSTLMGINFLDHIIIGKNCYNSFRENRLIEF